MKIYPYLRVVAQEELYKILLKLSSKYLCNLKQVMERLPIISVGCIERFIKGYAPKEKNPTKKAVHLYKAYWSRILNDSRFQRDEILIKEIMSFLENCYNQDTNSFGYSAPRRDIRKIVKNRKVQYGMVDKHSINQLRLFLQETRFLSNDIWRNMICDITDACVRFLLKKR